ncbi:SixA phosphatase family protein [Aestuariivirga sp.]|uniref:SixA phosphatase family protein n=1 Tax=Aestuariivirga sp. TaxID=2650926 RepID=UPI0039E2804B
MLTLMLLRHAKSSWSEKGLTDLERPLNGRGKRAAKAMGEHMQAQGWVPDAVLCSPARRARETWATAQSAFTKPPECSIENAAYDFGDGSALLTLIQRNGRKARRLLLVGHNPSLEELAQRLIDRGDEKLRQRIEKKYPTAALAVITFTLSSWEHVIDHTGVLEAFVRPRDILDGEED